MPRANVLPERGSVTWFYFIYPIGLLNVAAGGIPLYLYGRFGNAYLHPYLAGLMILTGLSMWILASVAIIRRRKGLS